MATYRFAPSKESSPPWLSRLAPRVRPPCIRRLPKIETKLCRPVVRDERAQPSFICRFSRCRRRNTVSITSRRQQPHVTSNAATDAAVFTERTGCHCAARGIRFPCVSARDRSCCRPRQPCAPPCPPPDDSDDPLPPELLEPVEPYPLSSFFACCDLVLPVFPGPPRPPDVPCFSFACPLPFPESSFVRAMVISVVKSCRLSDAGLVRRAVRIASDAAYSAQRVPRSSREAGRQCCTEYPGRSPGRANFARSR